jgi:DNA-binding CsgD family transcriptional regulator
VACAEAGVVGYVGAEGSLDDVTAAIEGAARGEPRCTPQVVAALLRRVAALAGEVRPTRVGLPALTGREHQVVALIEAGLSNKEIARRLHVEVATVKNHVHNILKKLQARSRVEIVARVRQVQGWPSNPLVLADDAAARTWPSPGLERRRNPGFSPAEADGAVPENENVDQGAGAHRPLAARAGS